MLYTIIIVLVSLLTGFGGGFYFFNKRKDELLNDLQNQNADLQSKAEGLVKEKQTADTKILELQQIETQYKALSDKVLSLNRTVQSFSGEESISKQIDQLENFFEAFRNKPPQLKKTFRELRKMEEAYRRINLLHNNVMKPMIGMLRTAEKERTENTNQMILAEMLEALWLTFDAIETLADPDNNSRHEQKLSLDIIEKRKTKEDAYEEAKEITTDPTVTPTWARTIRHAVLPLNIDNYPIIFSGYKLAIPYK